MASKRLRQHRCRLTCAHIMRSFGWVGLIVVRMLCSRLLTQATQATSISRLNSGGGVIEVRVCSRVRANKARNPVIRHGSLPNTTHTNRVEHRTLHVPSGPSPTVPLATRRPIRKGATENVKKCCAGFWATCMHNLCIDFEGTTQLPNGLVSYAQHQICFDWYAFMLTQSSGVFPLSVCSFV